MKPKALLPLVAFALLASTLPLWSADAKFTPPPSPRVTYNFNSDWRFIRQDVPGAEVPSFDDSQWESVSTPHTFNDVDSFRVIIDHSGGDRGTYKGISWYRKHFKLPAAAAGSKVFIEFEGMRQAGDIYLNGLPVGLYENGVTGYGVDITSGVHFGDQENVIAVRADNTTSYRERATNTAFRWNANDFNPDFGGINRRVWLHLTGNIYQTLPLYQSLGTTGPTSTAPTTTLPRIAAPSMWNRRCTMPRPTGGSPARTSPSRPRWWTRTAWCGPRSRARQWICWPARRLC